MLFSVSNGCYRWCLSQGPFHPKAQGVNECATVTDSTTVVSIPHQLFLPLYDRFNTQTWTFPSSLSKSYPPPALPLADALDDIMRVLRAWILHSPDTPSGSNIPGDSLFAYQARPSSTFISLSPLHPGYCHAAQLPCQFLYDFASVPPALNQVSLNRDTYNSWYIRGHLIGYIQYCDAYNFMIDTYSISQWEWTWTFTMGVD